MTGKYIIVCFIVFISILYIVTMRHINVFLENAGFRGMPIISVLVLIYLSIYTFIAAKSRISIFNIIKNNILLALIMSIIVFIVSAIFDAYYNCFAEEVIRPFRFILYIISLIILTYIAIWVLNELTTINTNIYKSFYTSEIFVIIIPVGIVITATLFIEKNSVDVNKHHMNNVNSVIENAIKSKNVELCNSISNIYFYYEDPNHRYEAYGRIYDPYEHKESALKLCLTALVSIRDRDSTKCINDETKNTLLIYGRSIKRDKGDNHKLTIYNERLNRNSDYSAAKECLHLYKKKYPNERNKVDYYWKDINKTYGLQ